MSDFGDAVRIHRQALGMTQRALADRVGLHRSHFNRIERGNDPPPRVEKVLRLVDALRLNRSEAEVLVQSAGYPTTVLDAGGSLSYPSGSVTPTGSASLAMPIRDRLQRIGTALAPLPVNKQVQYLDAILVLVGACEDRRGHHS